MALCTSADDVLLTTARGRCIRFAADEVRVFASRDSTGVRGVRLAEGDSVISMAILRAVDATPAERAAYLKHASAARSGRTARATRRPRRRPLQRTKRTPRRGPSPSPPERIAELEAAEQIVLTVSSEGFGKRTSAYDYRRTGRGGQGLIAQDLSRRGGRLVASFPVEDSDELLLVTDQGQLIRCPVGQVRIAGRNTQGVTIFRTAENEHVVSVERLEGDPAAAEDADQEAAPQPPAD